MLFEMGGVILVSNIMIHEYLVVNRLICIILTYYLKYIEIKIHHFRTILVISHLVM